MEPVPQAHGETLLTQAPAAVNEIYPNETGARCKPSTNGGQPQGRGQALSNAQQERTRTTAGAGTRDRGHKNKPQYIAPSTMPPIKPHKPRNRTGVYRYTPNIKARTRGVISPPEKGHKKSPAHIGRGMYY